ncbi:MAG: hypothetical protein K6F58_00205 [Bacteroidales bacterium]|nr:hypothetical protein [Bacteroidales bacterium]
MIIKNLQTNATPGYVAPDAEQVVLNSTCPLMASFGIPDITEEEEEW